MQKEYFKSNIETVLKEESIGSTGEIITLLITVGFVVSLVYDWGFLFALNLSFDVIPTKISDHFRSGLLWFPPLLLIIFAYYAIEFQFQRVERGLTEDEIVTASKNPIKTKRFRDGPSRLIAWTAPLYVLSFFLIGDLVSAILPFALAVVWLSFSEWCYSAPLIQLRRSRKVHAAFTILPVIGLIAFSSGYSSAIEAVQVNPREVSISIAKTSTNITAKLLRSFEAGTLIMTNSGEIQFLPTAVTSAVTYKPEWEPYKGFLCEWFGRCVEIDSSKKSNNHSNES